MFYDEEELLEAVDMLIEDYDLTEDEAMEIVLESYEDEDFDDEELDELSEAVEILMEDYDLDEDEAIDLLMEFYDPSLDAAHNAAINLSIQDATRRINSSNRAIQSYNNKILRAAIIKDYNKPSNRIKRKIKGVKKSVRKARKQKLRKKRIKRVRKALHLK